MSGVSGLSGLPGLFGLSGPSGLSGLPTDPQQNQQNQQKGGGLRGAPLKGGKRHNKNGYTVRGGSLGCSQNDGFQVNPRNPLKGSAGAPLASISQQMGGNSHHSYDCSQPEWGPECL